MIGGTFIIVPISVLVNKNLMTGGKFVKNSKFSDFGLCVKTKLLQLGLDQKWLINAVSEKTGLYMDSSYLYKVLTGQRNAPKIVTAICDILSIQNNQKG